jgi:hypothetical protein
MHVVNLDQGLNQKTVESLLKLIRVFFKQVGTHDELEAV